MQGQGHREIEEEAEPSDIDLFFRLPDGKVLPSNRFIVGEVFQWTLRTRRSCSMALFLLLGKTNKKRLKRNRLRHPDQFALVTLGQNEAERTKKHIDAAYCERTSAKAGTIASFCVKLSDGNYHNWVSSSTLRNQRSVNVIYANERISWSRALVTHRHTRRRLSKRIRVRAICESSQVRSIPWNTFSSPSRKRKKNRKSLLGLVAVMWHRRSADDVCFMNSLSPRIVRCSSTFTRSVSLFYIQSAALFSILLRSRKRGEGKKSKNIVQEAADLMAS